MARSSAGNADLFVLAEPDAPSAGDTGGRFQETLGRVEMASLTLLTLLTGFPRAAVGRTEAEVFTGRMGRTDVAAQ